MPFGSKPVGGAIVDFDAVHAILLKPAVEAARLQPLRADEERAGGIIHRQMFERLVLCDMALADLSSANANVFYELGIRHGTRPGATVLVFAENTPPPFDLGPCRAIAYGIDANGNLTRPEQDRAAIAEALREAQRQRQDSPNYELLQGFPDLDHSKTDLFRDQVAYWAYATALELTVLAGDEAGAHAALGEALACGPVPWMLQTTLDTLEMMRRSSPSLPW
jgi:hypothetical protein